MTVNFSLTIFVKMRGKVWMILVVYCPLQGLGREGWQNYDPIKNTTLGWRNPVANNWQQLLSLTSREEKLIFSLLKVFVSELMRASVDFKWNSWPLVEPEKRFWLPIRMTTFDSLVEACVPVMINLAWRIKMLMMREEVAWCRGWWRYSWTNIYFRLITSSWWDCADIWESGRGICVF